MRPIEFRFYDPISYIFIYSDWYEKMPEFFEAYEKTDWGRNERLPLQQHTGLKDAEGNKIFESDILEFDNGDRFFIDCEDWLELFVHWIGEPECEDQARDFYRIEYAIVIGNIYENEELFDEQK